MRRLMAIAAAILMLWAYAALAEGSGLSIDAPREEVSPGRPVILSFTVPEDGTCSIGLKNEAGSALADEGRGIQNARDHHATHAGDGNVGDGIFFNTAESVGKLCVDQVRKTCLRNVFSGAFDGSLMDIGGDGAGKHTAFRKVNGKISVICTDIGEIRTFFYAGCNGEKSIIEFGFHGFLLKM